MSKIILLTILFCAIVFEANSFVHNRVAENNFANILLKSSALIKNSPQHSWECFSIYIPKINDLTAKYELAYGTCLQRSANNRSAIDKEVECDRKDLELSAIDVCGALGKCSQQNSSYESFECYHGASGEAMKATKNIQNVSKDKMEYITMRFKTIEYEQNHCTDACSREYVDETTKTYADLDKCLAGISVVLVLEKAQPETTVPPTEQF